MLYPVLDYRLAALAIALVMLIAYEVLRLSGLVSAQRNASECEDEARFRILAEAIPEIVWTATPGQGIDYCNQRLLDLTGLKAEQILGWNWKNVLHPDDLPVALENWEKAHLIGKPLDAEYRYRMANGDYRWYLVRATPMRDSSGNILKWFGCCVDIDDSMRNQQLLEEQIKEYTAALLEANTRLETEMRERGLAQQELNQQNERMVQELTRRSQRATTLAKMAELLQSCADLKDVFGVVTGMAPKIFPELSGAVLLFNSSHDVLEVATSWTDCRLPASVFAPQDCWALRTGHLHLAVAGDHTAECKHAASAPYGYFCVPLLSQGEAIGILHFQGNGPAELADGEMLLATTFGEQVGLSISNIRLREALRTQSIRDPLTGLFNRRYLEETLQREIRRSVRSEQSLGVLMLDLDHFKKFNDTYGHDAGDAVLCETATFLTKSVRAEDVVCRFGGEEFVIILPVADLRATQARGEKICSKLRELTVLHQGQSLGMITVSVGVAALPEHGTSPSALLEAADTALYRAKREGRDRVALASLKADDRVNAVGTHATSS
jgi:diguanylate cyclase (GGDEF)-like protein/PAS domain S-box-containing protein